MSEDGSDGAAGTPAQEDERVEFARLLARIDLFSGLDRVDLARVAAQLKPIDVAPREAIFRQGEAGDALYLVASGSVGVHVARANGEGSRFIKALGPGEPFGELALFTNRPRSATMIAETPTTLLRLERTVFLDLVRQKPTVALAIAATLSRRLDEALYGTVTLEAPAPAPAPPSGDARQDGRGRAAGRAGWRAVLPVRPLVAALMAVGFLAMGWLVPPPQGLSQAGWQALAILLAALPALALDVLMEGVLALLLAAAWTLADVAEPEVALAGFASESWVLVVAVLVIGAAMTTTGLFYRLALATIARAGGGFSGQVAALSAVGMAMGPAVPNATSRVIIIAPLLGELAEAAGYRPKSKAAAGLAMTVLIAFGQMAAVFLTSSTTAVLVAALLPTEIGWMSWAAYGAPLNIVLFAGLLATIFWVYRPGVEDKADAGERAASLALQRALLGPMSGREKVALIAGAAMLAGFVSQPLHGVHPAWIAVFAVALLAARGVVTINTLRSVNWNFALLFGVLISLAGVVTKTGVDVWLAGHIAGLLGDLARSPELFLLAFAGLCFATSFVVRWQAAAPLLTIAMVPAAAGAGIDPYLVGLIAVVACNGFFLPYQSTTYLALCAGTDGKLFSHAQARPMALAYGAWTLVAILIALQAWRQMGLV